MFPKAKMQTTRFTLVKSQHSSTAVIETTHMFVKNLSKNMCVAIFLFNNKSLIWFPAWVVESTCVGLQQFTWRNGFLLIIFKVVPSIIYTFMWKRSRAVMFRNKHMHSSFVKMFNMNKHIIMYKRKIYIATCKCSCQCSVQWFEKNH